MDWKSFQFRKPSDEEIRDWARLYPDANIAVVTGAVSGLLVIDNDGEDPPVPMRQTCSVRTARGLHYYFQYPTDHGFRNQVRIGGRKVDVRGEGGYVLAPDSVHPETGELYSWLVPPEEGIPELPDELRAFLSEKPRQAERVWLQGLQGVEEGKRNDTAASIVGKLLASNPPELWEYAVWGGLKAWNTEKCRPPLEDGELRTTYESIRDSHAHKKGLTISGDRTFKELVQMYDERYEHYDKGSLAIVMGAAIINHLPQQDSLWINLVAPASSSKTETIRGFRLLPDAEWVSQITSKTFFSGRGKEYSWAYQLPNPCLILVEDTTTLFEMPAEERGQVVRTLRLMYTRDFRALSGNIKAGEMDDWNKKVSIIMGTTERIDTADVAGMQVVAGSRSLMYRLWVPKRDDPRRLDINRKSVKNGETNVDAREFLQEQTRNCYLSLLNPAPMEPTLSDAQIGRIASLADMVSLGRHTNIRDPRTGDIEQIPEPEQGARVSQQLALIAKGQALIHRRSEVSDADIDMAVRVARDTLPELPLVVLSCVNDIPRTVEDITQLVAQYLGKRYPLAAIRRRLEDLAAGGLVLDHSIQGGKQLWQHSDRFKQLNSVAKLILPGEG